MSTNEERRLEAKRKLEQRLSDQEQAARKRKWIIGGSLGTVALVALVGFGTWGLISYNNSQYNKNHARCTYKPTEAYPNVDQLLAAANQQADQAVQSGQATPEQAQQYKDSQAKQAIVLREHASQSRPSAQPTELRPSKNDNPTVVMDTSQGTITMDLKGSSAPCNVNAITTLVEAGFYNNTPCHRMVSSPQMSVLQCGDPTGTGSGTPGWTSPDEFPTDLKPAPGEQGTNGYVVYPRGTIAIANGYQAANPMSGQPASGENTGSSQFFIAINDSQLPGPNYSVIGHVDDASLAVLDKIKAGGLNPPMFAGPDAANQPVTDGQPKLPVQIVTAKVS